jgi:hypothetical protein
MQGAAEGLPRVAFLKAMPKCGLAEKRYLWGSPARFKSRGL